MKYKCLTEIAAQPLFFYIYTKSINNSKSMDAAAVIKKLRYDPSMKALIHNAPSELLTSFYEIKFDNRYDGATDEKQYDFVMVFATNQQELEFLIKHLRNAGKHDCIFWACYPKGTGAIKSDIKRETVWSAFSLIGMRPVSQIAIDETWSALRGRPAVAEAE